MVALNAKQYAGKMMKSALLFQQVTKVSDQQPIAMFQPTDFSVSGDLMALRMVGMPKIPSASTAKMVVDQGSEKSR